MFVELVNILKADQIGARIMLEYRVFDVEEEFLLDFDG